MSARVPHRRVLAAPLAAACLAAGAALAVALLGGEAVRARRELAAVAGLPGAPAGPVDRWLAPRRSLRAWLADPGTPAPVRRAAAQRLARQGAWTWAAPGAAIVHRWLRETAAEPTALDGADARLAAARLADLPGDPRRPDDPARATVQAWLDAAGPPDAIRAALFDRLGAGHDGTPVLADPGLVPADPRGRRLRQLALEGVPVGLDAELAAFAGAAAGPSPWPVDVADALLVRLATAWPERLLGAGDASEAALVEAASPAGRAVALGVVARERADLRPAAVEALERPGRRGPFEPAARVRRALAPPPAPAAVLAASGPDAGLRAAIAAWRGPASRDAAALDRLMDDPGVPPALVALVAARDADPSTLPRLAERWIRSLDDRRKRAGAVLVAAAPGAAPAAPLLARAHAAEDRGDVRLVQRLALRAAGLDPGEGPADRLLRDRAAPAIRATAGLLLALSGDAEGLRALARLPDGFDAADVAVREAAFGRLVPEWTTATGPIVGGPAVARLQLDRLAARRLLAGSRLRFDPAARRFLAPSSGRARADSPPAAAPPP